MIELVLAIPTFLVVVFLIVFTFVKGTGVAVQVLNGLFKIGKDLLAKGYHKARSKMGIETKTTA